MALSPTAVQAQVSALVAQYGEPVDLNRGGVHRTVRAFFDSADTALISRFVDDNTAVGLIRPAIVMLCDGTMSGTVGTLGAPNVGDTYPRDGRTFQVVKLLTFRLSSTVIVYASLCD